MLAFNLKKLHKEDLAKGRASRKKEQEFDLTVKLQAVIATSYIGVPGFESWLLSGFQTPDPWEAAGGGSGSWTLPPTSETWIHHGSALGVTDIWGSGSVFLCLLCISKNIEKLILKLK